MAIDNPTVVQVLQETLRRRHCWHFFQPIWHLGTGHCIGFEALARFPHQTPPVQVWELAQRQGVAADLDAISFATAIAEGQHLPGTLFINMGVGRLTDIHTCDRLVGSLARGRHTLRQVVLEITEEFADSVNLSRIEASRWRRRGWQFALDDAGMAHSNRERLRWLQPLYVKLDRSLVVAWEQGQKEPLREWVRDAKAEGAQLIAEGIEDPDLRHHLYAAGVAFGQGFGLGRPTPADVWQRSMRMGWRRAR